MLVVDLLLNSSLAIAFYRRSDSAAPIAKLYCYLRFQFLSVIFVFVLCTCLQSVCHLLVQPKPTGYVHYNEVIKL